MSAGNRQCEKCAGTGRVHEDRCRVCQGRGHFGPLDSCHKELISKLEEILAIVRKDCEVSRKGEVLTYFPTDSIDDELMVVEADGTGGADILLLEGPYPFMENCLLKYSHHFDHEQEACQAAEWLDEHINDVDVGGFFSDLKNGKSPHLTDYLPIPAADDGQTKVEG